MTDQPTDLEAELASLQPSPLSDECLRGVDRTLSDSAQPFRRLHARRLVLITALAAACFLVAAILHWELLSEHPRRPGISGCTPTPSTSRSPATAAAYRQAIARGPAALDALLDQETAASLRPQCNNNPLRAGCVANSEWVNWFSQHHSGD